ncbi:MAG: alpha/beta hydrolase [Myxococcota bacterium]|nr:alpha/beta hydrolase [Myxococcota bacterium]
MRRWLHAGRYTSRYVQTSAGRLHYYETGHQGPALVALHGVSSGATLMAPLLQKLAPHFGRIVAPDMPGHGFSHCPEHLDLEGLYRASAQLLDQALDAPSVLFGHSLGGALAVRYALERPERVSGLCLLSPAGAPSPDDERQGWLDQFEMGDHRAAVDFVRRLYIAPPVYLPMVARACRFLFRRTPIRQLVASARDNFALTLSASDVSSLPIPVRLVWGDAETTMLSAHRAFWLEHLPAHAEIVTPAHFTHCPYLEHVGEVAQIVTEFATAIPHRTEAAA